MESLIYFLLFAGAFFLMMRFGCGAHVMGHGHGHGESSSGRAESDSQARLVPPAKDIDPVCGMTVQTADGELPRKVRGESDGICKACRDHLAREGARSWNASLTELPWYRSSRLA